MVTNEKVQKRLAKRDLKGLSVDDPFDRQQLVGELSKIRGVERKDAMTAVDAYARRYNGKNSVIRTAEQRRELATYVSRKGAQPRKSTPFMSGLYAANERRYARSPTMLSKGRGIRKIERKQFYRLVDSRTKRSASIVANELRNMGVNARVMPYFENKRVAGYTVYSEKPIYTIKSKRQIGYHLSKNSPLTSAGRTTLRKEYEAGRVVRVPKKMSELGLVNRIPAVGYRR